MHSCTVPTCPLQGKGPFDGFLCVWCFIPPDPVVLERVSAWLEARGFEGGLQSAKVPKVKQLQQLCAAVPGVELVYQHAGQIVTVRPGWVHCVVNLERKVAISWEFVRHEQLALYQLAWEQIACRFTHAHNAPGYMTYIAMALKAAALIGAELRQ